MGDLVRLHDDNIVPVSWGQPGPELCSLGQAAFLLIFLLSPLHCCFLLLP